MKIGIVGSGMIARYVLNLWEKFNEIEAVSIWCRMQDEAEANKMAEEFQITNVYTDYEKFLNDDSFDFVYIGLVNSLHYEYAKQALLAGKSVICEKPFTSTGEQAQKLFDIAKEKGVYLFESCLPWYCDNYEEIKKILPEIGDVKMIECNFSQYSRRYESYLNGTILPVFNPDLDGGALYDLGVYSVHFIMGLLGNPHKVHYHPNIGYNGIDTSGVLIMDYGQFKGVCIHAKDCAAPSRCVIEGNKGCIVMESHPGEVKNISLNLNGQESKQIDVIQFEDGFRYVYEKIITLVNSHNYESCYKMIEDVIKVMRVMEEARKDADIKFSCD